MKNLLSNGLKIALIGLSLLGMTPMLYAKSTTISPWIYKQLSQADRLIAKQDYAKARQKLEKILLKVSKNSYAQAIILRSLASLYALENKYQQATEYLEQALTSQVLTDVQQEESQLNLGQLYMAMEQYQKTLDILKPWLKKHADTTDPQVRILLANAHAQLQQYRQALPYIEHVIKQTKKPKASWLQLKLALHYELEEYSKAGKILRRLITLYPNEKNYWQQLASIYQQLKQYKSALTIKNLAYKQHFLDSETEIKQLFNLFLYNKQPYHAALLLAQALEAKNVKPTSANWELLANAWTHAKEYKQAINALEKASIVHEKGNLYIQLGRIYIEQEQWQEAIDAIKKAFKKGSLKQAGEAYILLGISYYETGKLKAANAAFTGALDDRKTRKSAQQWLNYITTKASS